MHGSRKSTVGARATVYWSRGIAVRLSSKSGSVRWTHSVTLNSVNTCVAVIDFCLMYVVNAENALPFLGDRQP
jgi:hypothetical protein